MGSNMQRRSFDMVNVEASFRRKDRKKMFGDVLRGTKRLEVNT